MFKVAPLRIIVLIILASVSLLACARPVEPQAAAVQIAATATSAVQEIALPTVPLPVPTLSPPGGYPPPALPTPTATPIPNCNFTLLDEVVAGEMSAAEMPYRFSPPEVVLTGSYGFETAQWLPDNQRLLVIEQFVPNHEILTLDTHTGNTTTYGSRLGGNYSNPLWVERLNGVIYTAVDEVGEIELKFTNGQQVRKLQTQLDSVNIAQQREALEVVALLDGEQLVAIDAVSGSVRSLTQRPFEPIGHPNPIGSTSKSHNLSSSPDGRWVLLYKRAFVQLVDNQARTNCLLSLSREGLLAQKEIFYVQWSPDGQYMALVAAVNDQATFLIADMETRKLQPLALPVPADPSIRPYIYDMTWAPDNTHLVAYVHIFESGEYTNLDYLYLIDTKQFRSRRILEEEVFNWKPRGMPWSANGELIAMACSTASEGRVCLIAVEEVSQ